MTWAPLCCSGPLCATSQCHSLVPNWPQATLHTKIKQETPHSRTSPSGSRKDQPPCSKKPSGSSTMVFMILVQLRDCTPSVYFRSQELKRHYKIRIKLYFPTMSTVIMTISFHWACLKWLVFEFPEHWPSWQKSIPTHISFVPQNNSELFLSPSDSVSHLSLYDSPRLPYPLLMPP